MENSNESKQKNKVNENTEKKNEENKYKEKINELEKN